MKRALLLLAVSIFAGSSVFAQANNHSPSSSPKAEGTTPAGNERTRAGYQFHAQLYNSCCFYPGFTEASGPEAYEPEEESQTDEIGYAHGEPDWQPSTFMKFSKAVSLGQRQQAALNQPSQPPSPGDIAREQRESENPDEKAQVVIKQKADETAVIVPRKQ